MKGFLFKVSNVKYSTKMGKFLLFEDTEKRFVLLKGIKDAPIVSATTDKLFLEEVLFFLSMQRQNFSPSIFYIITKKAIFSYIKVSW